MSTQLSLENFEQTYDLTYQSTLKYILCKCSNIEDVNDLLQDTYVELYRILQRKGNLILENQNGFIIGIAKKKLLKYYGLFYQLKTSSLWNQKDKEEYLIDLPDNIDFEEDVLTKLEAQEVWNYIKTKDEKVVKIFYLYYSMGLKIKEIAKELKMSESNIKNILYRTIKEVKQNIKIEGDNHV